jgi:anthranilate phosphoribosyltransferase
MAEAVLDGQRGPSRDVVLLNAGAALYVAGLAESIADGIGRVGEELDSGRARSKLAEVVATSQRIKTETAHAAKAEVA